MPDEPDSSILRPVVTAFFVLAMIVVLAEVVMRRLFGTRRRGALDHDVPPSMSRGTASAATRNAFQLQYATAQANQLLGRPATAPEVAQAHDVLRNEVLVRGAEFNGRHIVADSFMRSAVVEVLRQPDLVRETSIRQLFQALGADSLVATWDTVTARLRGPGRTWFVRVGAAQIENLRRALDNVQTLFLSEKQGNLHAGTHIDVTDEARALLGPDRVRTIVTAATGVMEDFGLRPHLRTVGREVLLSYDGASGEFHRFGYSPGRTHDAPIDPLSLLPARTAVTVFANSAWRVKVRYCFAYHPWKVMVALIVLLAGLAAAIRWSEVDRVLGANLFGADR